ncbi:MAG TPA: alkaline phosphatase family protein [Gemmatimonadaceae bacterium]|nr:alkaline phosphatase family protein [Gemmatimonadaceae bacterium]
MNDVEKVIVVGLDGLEPTIVDRLLARGELPNLARLRAQGGYSRVATTTPAQTPVAWSTFATGVNPGGHGIFDFLRRDPATYLPDLALNRYEQKSAFLPPKVVNLRRGTPVWRVLGDAGIASAIIRCPCTYPPDDSRGRMLSGMGVPDLRGGLGTSTFYSNAADLVARESEQVVPLVLENGGTRATAHVIGPRNPKSRADLVAPITLELDPSSRSASLQSEGQPRTIRLREGEWSEWLRLKFKSGLLQSVSGIVRFLLVSAGPDAALYASPVNFDPLAPHFPISHPWEYATELQREFGDFYTTGMVEDHTGLSNERFDEAAYLAQCDGVMREREQMLMHELSRQREGLVFCLFDTPDRLQHMFWRFGEEGHPANREQESAEYAGVIEEHYRQCDALVGRVLAAVDDRTLCIVMSDHGFNSFQRGVHLNAWLHAQGLLALKPGIRPGEDAGELLRQVDWSRTQAYAMGLGSIYLNIRGRESEGIVAPDEAPSVARRVADALTGLVDPDRGAVAIRRVRTRDELYSGPFAEESPDLVVHFAAGYRVSWTTALGGVPDGLVEDNVKKWGGDHIIDPELVPGVLFMNRPFAGGAGDVAAVPGPRLQDLAPTILASLGVPAAPAMEGRSLLD